MGRAMFLNPIFCWCVGLCSLLGAHKVLFVSSKSLFPKSCVSSGGTMVGLMVTSSKRAYCQVYCTQSPCLCDGPLLTHTSIGDTKTLKGRSCSVSVGSPGAREVLFESSEHLWCVWGLGFYSKWDFAPVAQLIKNLPAMWKTWAQSLRWEDPLEKGTATHYSILAWRIPWTIHGIPKSPTRQSNFHFTSKLHKMR